MKKEIRILGIDDSSFNRFRDKKVFVIGAFFRGGDWIDGIMTTTARIDGNDAAGNIIKMVKKSKFRTQIQAILLDGIAVAGFNVIDIEELNKKTKMPVIVVVRRYPDFRRIFSVLEKLKMKKKIEIIRRAGEPVKIGKIYAQFKGIKEQDVREILKITCTRSFIPEPIRVAHLIGQGIGLGESKGNA
ncbi:MAG: DUF99 family protein [Candidatus Woesearchaeota archaeon]|nr:DUF99 family protein [Candidatus Woesearchaeota archaeon]